MSVIELYYIVVVITVFGDVDLKMNILFDEKRDNVLRVP